MNEEEFRKVAKDKGYGEVEFLELGPGPEEEMHCHEHSVISCVLTGEFTLTTNEWARVLLPGDMHENPAGTMHKAKPGPEGGTFLFAKKLS